MVLKRRPRPALRPFVEELWAIDEADTSRPAAARREHVLPTGRMHIALRLADNPLRLFDDSGDAIGHVVGDAVVGGARASFYIREIPTSLGSVGAQLRPGGAQALFGVAAHELSGRHTPLEDVWGRSVTSMRDQLAGTRSPADRLDLFEAMLAARLPRARGLHPAVAQALERFAEIPDVRGAVRQSGYSHRTFLQLFRQCVGLTPKLYCRLLRFQRVLRVTSSDASLIDLAMAAGYSDQSHFNREFREFTGLTPTAYRRAAPATPHHLSIGSERAGPS